MRRAVMVLVLSVGQVWAGPPAFLSQPRRVKEGVVKFLARDPVSIGVGAGQVPTFWISEKVACVPAQRAGEKWCTVGAASTPTLNVFRMCDVAGANCVSMPEVMVGCFKTCGKGDCPSIFVRSATFQNDPPATPPAVPSNLRMVPTKGGLLYKWHDNSCDALFFTLQLQRGTTSGTWIEVARPAAPSGGGKWCDSAGECQYEVNSERPYDWSGPRGGWHPPDGLQESTLYYGRVGAVNEAGMMNLMQSPVEELLVRLER